MDENAFIYVTKGSVEFDGMVHERETCLIFIGEGFSVLRIDEGSEVVFIKGKKINEEIVQDGHFVI